MKKKYSKSLFIFRRDLRLEDNVGLNEALKLSDQVIPCFIFDPRQVEKNPYKSENALQFLLESLDDLSKQIKEKKGKIYFFHGKAEEVVESLILKERVDALFLNEDYTSFSKARDTKIEKVCSKNKVFFKSCFDLLLVNPLKFAKDDGTPYTVFTPFFNRSSKLPVNSPKSLQKGSFFSKNVTGELKGDCWKYLSTKNENIAVHGGRVNCLDVLSSIKSYKKYDEERDFPSLDKTTHLSAHLKFGTCSVREIYYAIKEKLGVEHPLLRQLYWRDFFSHIAHHFPEVFGNSFQAKFESIDWSNDKSNFKKWCEGKTGFPIIDAGMRELNETGYMHNRVRMIVASFLTKDLHIDWRDGERYFAQKLVDYDPALNNGNWQWASSTGCDAQPYFRIFNPWLQQKRFDVDCTYIKKWVPELEPVENSIIHSLDKNLLLIPKDYVKPIVDHSVESRFAKDVYAQAASNYI